jgi:hypothetical protein
MAIKKTVKKRRTTKKVRVSSIESIIDTLRDNAQFSAVNKRAIDRLKKSASSVAKQQKLFVSAQERVDKARLAIKNAKTPVAKDKAKIRLALALSKLKEIKTILSSETAEQKKAERLLRSLDRAFASAHMKMQREYDRKAKALEKGIDKPARRRRTSKKKVVID